MRRTVIGIRSGHRRVFLTDILMAGLALITSPTRDRPVQQNLVTGFHMADTRTHGLDDAGTLMT
jgi:hypothetical protein